MKIADTTPMTWEMWSQITNADALELDLYVGPGRLKKCKIWAMGAQFAEIRYQHGNFKDVVAKVPIGHLYIPTMKSPGTISMPTIAFD